MIRYKSTASCHVMLLRLILFPNSISSLFCLQNSKSPFIGNLQAFQRNSQDKPDLLKGSFGGTGGTLRKQSGLSNIKEESETLAVAVLGEKDRTARYKVSTQTKCYK